MGRGLQSGGGGLVGLPGCSREFGCLSAKSRRGCGGVRARMLEVHIPSVGPEAEESRQSPEKGHMVSIGWRVRVGIHRISIPSTSAKGNQDTGLGRPSQRFGVTGFASPSDDNLDSSGILWSRGAGPSAFSFRCMWGAGGISLSGRTPSRLCPFRTPESGRGSCRNI